LGEKAEVVTHLEVLKENVGRAAQGGGNKKAPEESQGPWCI